MGYMHPEGYLLVWSTKFNSLNLLIILNWTQQTSKLFITTLLVETLMFQIFEFLNFT